MLALYPSPDRCNRLLGAMPLRPRDLQEHPAPGLFRLKFKVITLREAHDQLGARCYPESRSIAETVPLSNWNPTASDEQVDLAFDRFSSSSPPHLNNFEANNCVVKLSPTVDGRR
jgi:hypothetical protein